MVFFTCVIVVLVLYYLQTDGLIFVTIIAVIAELINIFLTQTLTKSIKKQTGKKFLKIINGYKAKVAAQKKSIKEFQDLQDKAIKKLHNANLKIKEYEEKNKETLQTDNNKAISSLRDDNGLKEETKTETSDITEKKESNPKEFIDLPAGSNRKKLPI